jgi:hypothetical protein
MTWEVREAPLKYTVVFYVEADRREALEAAVKYVMEYVKDGVAMYACGRHVCVCKVKLEWDGNRLTVRSCVKLAVRIIAKRLAKAYIWHGGRSIRLVKCEEYKP